MQEEAGTQEPIRHLRSSKGVLMQIHSGHSEPEEQCVGCHPELEVRKTLQLLLKYYSYSFVLEQLAGLAKEYFPKES